MPANGMFDKIILLSTRTFNGEAAEDAAAERLLAGEAAEERVEQLGAEGAIETAAAWSNVKCGPAAGMERSG